MPVFVARFTTIRLCVADYGKNSLSPSVNTAKPQDQLDTIAHVFKTAAKEGGNLTEIPVRDGEFQLRYIGKDQDMPFYMVLVGQGKIPGMDMSTPNPTDSEELQRAPFDNVDIDSQYQYNRVEGGTNYHLQGTGEPSTIDKNEPQTRRSSLSQCASDPILSAATSNKMQLLTKDISLNGRRPFTNHQRSLKPQALCLTIALTKDSFIQQPYVLTGPPLDVKIDVFFNGVLSASTYVSERVRNSDPRSDDLIIRFSGLRVAQKIESSWVLVPPGQTADGKMRDPRRIKGGSKVAALSRWTNISKALQQEAAMDAKDTIIGQYLASLSELEMPAEAETLHSAGGPKYGVIDVVLTAGRGSKKEHAGIEHISEPTRMRVIKPGLERKRSVVDISKGATSDDQITTPSSSTNIVTPRSRSFADANIVAQGYTDTLPRDASKLLRTSESAASLRLGNIHTQSNTRLASRETSPPEGAVPSGRERLSRIAKSRSQSTQISPKKSSRCLSKSQNKPQDQAEKIPQKTFKGSETIVEEMPKQKRARMRYYSELTTKLTAEEEIAQIEAQSKENPAQPALDSSPAASTRRQSARRGESITPAPNVKHSDLVHASESQMGNSDASSTLGKRKRSQSVSAPKQRAATEKAKQQESVEASPATRSKVVTLRLTRQSLEENLVSSGATPLSTPADNEGRPKLPLPGTSMPLKTSPSSSLALSSRTPTPDKVERDFGAGYTSNKVASGRPKSSRVRPKGRSEASVTTTPLHKQTFPPPSRDTSSPYKSTRSHPNPLQPPLSPTLGPNEIANSLSHRNRVPRLSQENLSRLSNISTPMGFLPPPEPITADLSNRSNRTMGPPRPAWTIPALSEDCVITFAPDGFRPVKLERTGWFREYGILLGVRFLVG
ncbi:hypothetical protein MMC14_004712 [Varicellaria rhodocarpa]|nr:hypothetical protein [Varicellaria rhodocarpa]